MLKILLIAIPILLVLFIVIVALQSPRFQVARSVTVDASPETVFPYVNELRKWEPWNPWGKMDPAMKQTYEGPSSGVGAVSAWVGNKNVGEGRMTIIESRPGELVRLKLEFFKPMPGVSTAEFTFKPEGGRTVVTWSMSGKNNFVAKAFCLFANMDKMIGGQFEKGLAELKLLAESATRGVRS